MEQAMRNGSTEWLPQETFDKPKRPLTFALGVIVGFAVGGSIVFAAAIIFAAVFVRSTSG